jgi:hypothetical protein
VAAHNAGGTTSRQMRSTTCVRALYRSHVVPPTACHEPPRTVSVRVSPVESAGPVSRTGDWIGFTALSLGIREKFTCDDAIVRRRQRSALLRLVKGPPPRKCTRRIARPHCTRPVTPRRTTESSHGFVSRVPTRLDPGDSQGSSLPLGDSRSASRDQSEGTRPSAVRTQDNGPSIDRHRAARVEAGVFSARESTLVTTASREQSLVRVFARDHRRLHAS